jgi:hypothetical protein
MEYHTVYQYLQFLKQHRDAFDSLSPKVRWAEHSPAVLYAFRRIKALAHRVRRAEYALVHRVAEEVEIELAIIKERLSSCVME